MEKQELVANTIFTVTDFLTPQECGQFIARSEDGGYEAAPITTARGFQHRPEIRNNRRFMADDPELATRLWSRLQPFVPSPLEGCAALGLNERFRYYRYDVGQQFRWHADGCYRRPNGEESQLTFMVYLNDDFEGGETRFDLRGRRDNLVVKPRAGMALCFLHPLFHEGSWVLDGRKYVLRSDVMYEKPLEK